MSKETNKTIVQDQDVLLIKSPFQQEQMEKPVDSFAGIPMSAESPFVEIIWDPVRKTLAIISKIKKESLMRLIRKLADKFAVAGAPEIKFAKKAGLNLRFSDKSKT